MAKKERTSATTRVDMAALDKGLLALGQRVSAAAPKRRGSIVVQFTDTGAERGLEGAGQSARLLEAGAESPPIVRISGPASVIKQIIEGKKEASRAFLAGGIQVSGDLPYLEAMLKDLGLLECE